MREFKSTDIFAFGRIMRQMDIKEELNKARQENGDAEAIGFGLLYDIVCKASEIGSEKAIYKFISDVAEVSVEELEDMSPEAFLGVLEAMMKLESAKSFFAALAKWMK